MEVQINHQPPPTTKPPTTKPPPPTTPPPPVRYFEIFGLKKSTKTKEDRSLKVKKLPKFGKVGKVDQRSELQTMSIAKQLGCREKMKSTLCDKKKKTFVNLEACMPCDKNTEDYRKERTLEDNQKESNKKKRNRDALSPPTNDARKGTYYYYYLFLFFIIQYATFRYGG